MTLPTTEDMKNFKLKKWLNPTIESIYVKIYFLTNHMFKVKL